MILPDFTLAQIAGFLLAAALITLAPGPDNLSVLSLGLSRGRRAGIGFGLGCALGCFIHTLLATLGVTALIAASETAFTALKLAGAAYLCWLGWKALRSPGATLSADAEVLHTDKAMRPYLVRGFVANAINPKVALFFLAFLPQFVDPSRGHAAAQTALLGTLFAAQTVLIFGAIGWYAGTVGGWLRGRPAVGRWLDRATGVLFIGLGIRLALAGRN
ncbi:MAG: LysE family translocator [Rhodocyclaceae bacterium]|nr:LysE family translocator [Rhodocyclaceae bacterium]